MPSIDDLEAAVAAADSDELVVSQGGVVRKITRAQLLAGLQPQLAVGSGQLLGRLSSGTGAPEMIRLGTSFTTTHGQINAVPGFPSIAALSPGDTPNPPDLIALQQGGRINAVTYGAFIAGLTGLPGVDGGNLTVRPSFASAPRDLSAIIGDAVAVESFGALGDGQTDDSAAFMAAAASGRPIRLGPRTYVVNGQFTIATPGVALLGTAGVSTLLRRTQTGGGGWISVQAPGFLAEGIVFDAGGPAIASDTWGVLLTAACTEATLTRCVFRNSGGPTLGCGLVFLASDPTIATHTVRDCEFAGNAVHGVWVQACPGVSLIGCRAHDNASYGICVDYNDPAFVQKARLVQVVGCAAWNNARGISIGNYNETNTAIATWGNANPDALSVIVSANVCHDNEVYGIAASGRDLLLHGNLLFGNGTVANSGAGILANVSYSRVGANTITGSALFGIDCGGSIYSDIAGNSVDGGTHGINCGGGIAVRVTGNSVMNCSGWAVLAANVETDAQGNNFGLACDVLVIAENSIVLSTAAASGVYLRDGPANVIVARNDFVGTNGAVVGNCLWPATDSVIVEGNRWNASPRFICNPVATGSVQRLVFPDIADCVMVTDAPGGVQSIISAYQAVAEGQLTFVRITAGGQGYTHASVTVGGAGSGAVASAFVSNGAVIGVAVTAAGGGYGPIGAQVPITISGDGSGGAAVGYASTPLCEERQIRVRCNCAVVFSRVGSSPQQENWTLTDLTVAANGDVDWVAAWGMWRAVRATPALTGCVSASGYGSPAGVLAAPPGSDYRNLSGGAGETLWIKHSGTDANGWSAVA
jgi:hypothetical protein